MSEATSEATTAAKARRLDTTNTRRTGMASNRISDLEREWRSSVMDKLRAIEAITAASAENVSRLRADVEVLKAQVKDIDERQDALENARRDDHRSTTQGQRALTAQSIGVIGAVLVSILSFLLQHVQFK
jgi:hypothetical protein